MANERTRSSSGQLTTAPVNKLNDVNVISFIHLHAWFSSGECRVGNSPRRTWNASRSTPILDSSAGSSPIRDQVLLVIQSLHLDPGRPRGHLRVDLISRTCLSSSWSTCQPCFSIFTFIHSTYKKTGNQSARLQITAITKIAEYFERLLRRYGKAITYTLRKTSKHSSC